MSSWWLFGRRVFCGFTVDGDEMCLGLGEKTRAPPRSGASFPCTNSTGTSLTRFSMVSFSCFVIFRLKNVIVMGQIDVSAVN